MSTQPGIQPAQQDSYGHPVMALVTAGLGTYTSQRLNTLDQLLQVVVNITALAGTTPTLTVTILGVDSASGQPFTLLASAALPRLALLCYRLRPCWRLWPIWWAPRLCRAWWR